MHTTTTTTTTIAVSEHTYEQFFVGVVIKLHVVCHLAEWHADLRVIIDSLLLADVFRYRRGDGNGMERERIRAAIYLRGNQ